MGRVLALMTEPAGLRLLRNRTQPSAADTGWTLAFVAAGEACVRPRSGRYPHISLLAMIDDVRFSLPGESWSLRQP
jgi:hypothetical protein